MKAYNKKKKKKHSVAINSRIVGIKNKILKSIKTESKVKNKYYVLKSIRKIKLAKKKEQMMKLYSVEEGNK